ncbi:MAG: hypothetical protein AAF235_03415 [Planctomycetota bacterium]
MPENPQRGASMIDTVMAPVDAAAKAIARFHEELANPDASPTLLGYVIELGYDSATIITNNSYKLPAGGISKNSFLIIRPGSMKALIDSRGKGNEAFSNA